ncbi:slr1659 superfamily regulator [Brunnivagina elsteri]|uniref:STAS domain-containing protein n=1 Tax=Brunnivagina elsteri CCALA 953 TaxID=987040 RepID=A0A2A2TIR3_9CYAN|nr:hypothetical protein [Calothrix elsteri]PAX53839.1 hypothetical protein CK510_13260 [Calothrix elsteri CCALA 953]
MIQDENYHVWYDENSETIYLKGSLRLAGMAEYSPILNLLNDVASSASTININLTNLDLLNSSGVNMLSKFFIDMRKKPEVQMIMLASSKIPWQTKSLKNLQRLMPRMSLKFD